MKKNPLIAAAVAAIAGSACAQSSVAIFGVLDATLQHASEAGVHATRLNGLGGNQFSRIGFRGTEDLGGGLSAGFVLDAGLNVDSGAGAPTSTDNQSAGSASGGLTFNRRATVSLISRDWGELRLGRDFVPTYWNLTAFDPFGTAGAGSVNNIAQSALTRVSTVQTAVRASNSIGYVLPGLRGFYGQAMLARGENASNLATHDDGNYAGLRLGYAAGPLNVAVAAGRTTLASGEVATANAGASYELGLVKAMAQVFGDRKDLAAAPHRSRGWMLGAHVMTGSGYVPVSYASVKDNSSTGRRAQQWALGYVHNLSKRTALYATYSQLKNRNGAALTGGGVPGVANAIWKGLDLGLRHSF
jgi:predicted porin